MFGPKAPSATTIAMRARVPLFREISVWDGVTAWLLGVGVSNDPIGFNHPLAKASESRASKKKRAPSDARPATDFGPKDVGEDTNAPFGSPEAAEG